MSKGLVIGSVAVFVLWNLMDFVIHGVLLTAEYSRNLVVFRPMEEMKQGVIFAVTLISAIFFTLLYGEGFSGGTLGRSLRFGLYFGLIAGFSMGFGTYAVQPIYQALAVSWLLATLVEALVAAALLHWIFGRFAPRAT